MQMTFIENDEASERYPIKLLMTQYANEYHRRLMKQITNHPIRMQMTQYANDFHRKLMKQENIDQ